MGCQCRNVVSISCVLCPSMCKCVKGNNMQPCFDNMLSLILVLIIVAKAPKYTFKFKYTRRDTQLRVRCVHEFIINIHMSAYLSMCFVYLRAMYSCMCVCVNVCTCPCTRACVCVYLNLNVGTVVAFCKIKMHTRDNMITKTDR